MTGQFLFKQALKQKSQTVKFSEENWVVPNI